MQKMLDLDGDIVGDFRKLAMQGLDDANCVRGPVEEVRIAERDVPGAGRDLLADVGQNDIRLHNAEGPLIHRDHRTMPAQMLTPARCFRVAGDTLFGAGAELGILTQSRQAGAIRWQETESIQGHYALRRDL